MAWAVVTLEALVNHALAEALNNKVLAIMAIEYPGQIIEKIKIGQSPRSEFAKKIIILSDSAEQNTELIQLADELAETRNLIVHDKPFNFIDSGDGEVEINYYKKRGEDRIKYRYEELKSFYEKCDKIKKFILTKTDFSSLENFNFCSLIDG